MARSYLRVQSGSGWIRNRNWIWCTILPLAYLQNRDLRSFNLNSNRTNPIQFKVTGWFKILESYIYVARAYTLASIVGAIVQYCLRNQENPHVSVIIIISLHNSCGNQHLTRKRLHPDSIRIRIVDAYSIRDSIRMKISDSQVLSS